MILSGDNLTGEGEGFDEQIFLTLDDLPADIKSIEMWIIIYNAGAKGHDFGQVANASAQLFKGTDELFRDARAGRFNARYCVPNDAGLAHFEISGAQYAGRKALHVAKLYRKEAGGWDFTRVEEAENYEIGELFREYKFNSSA